MSDTTLINITVPAPLPVAINITQSATAVVVNASAIGQKGDTGPQGPQGPAGSSGGGGGGGNYTHTQGTPSATWNVSHGLGFYPNVTVVDSAESKVQGDVQYTDANNLVITFSAAFGGKAHLS